MNLLIIGILLVVGVLALVGLFFVLRSGSDEPEQLNQSATATSLPPESQARIELPGDEVETQAMVADAVTSGIIHQAQDTDALPIGQLQELAQELQVLHQQTQEIEQRLNVLATVVERIEHVQNGNHYDGWQAKPHNTSELPFAE